MNAPSPADYVSQSYPIPRAETQRACGRPGLMTSPSP